VSFLTQRGHRRIFSKYKAHQNVFSQGDPADSVFYIHKGKVKVTIVSARGKEGVVAIRGPDEFCGEDCLTGLPRRLYSVNTMSPCEIMRIEKDAVVRLLRYELEFADYFISHLLTRTAQVEADLAAQLFSSSEMRLARALLLLSNYGNDIGLAPIPVRVNHETLAKMIGTTRARVTTFMNKFRKSGFIDYNGKLDVHLSLLNFVLNQQGGLDLTE
jgi:CRP-like cAMP-binding protein